MRKNTRIAAGAAIAVLLSASLAVAQVPSIPPPPYNSPLGSGQIIAPPAAVAAQNVVIQNTLQVPATITRFFQSYGARGIVCTFNESAGSGSPNETIEVDAFDAASQTYQQLVVSGTISAANTPTKIELYPGIAQTHAVTGMVSQALNMPRFFRIKEVVTDQGSGGAAVTATVGCDLLN